MFRTQIEKLKTYFTMPGVGDCDFAGFFSSVNVIVWESFRAKEIWHEINHEIDYYSF